MSAKVPVIGVGPDGLAGLTARSRELLTNAQVVYGSDAALRVLPELTAERVTIGTDLPAVVADVKRRLGTQRLAVAAVGDPLFYGTARYLMDRVGVVFRTATEVEARSAGLAPGGGAVVIGLSRSSPWRPSGIRLHDLLVALDGAPLVHPEDLQNALREEGRESMKLDFVRDGERRSVEAPLSRRVTGAREFSIPLVFSYEHDRGVSEWSAILSIFQYRSTKAAWRFRLFWILRFGGGDEDQLLETGS